MITESEAWERIAAAVAPGPVEAVPLAEADGRWARETVDATLALPSFDNSAMDGWAVSAEDCGQTERWLQIVGEQPAGRPDPLAVAPGQAVRVFTGAPVAPSAGAVVMQEDAELSADGRCIRILDAAAPGEFIRRRGSDLAVGERVLTEGERLTPGRLGLLASQGRGTVAVGARPRLALLATGDELVAPGEPLPHAAAIYNSNAPMVSALARRAGAAAVTQVTVPDDLAGTRAAFAAALAEQDVVVVTGGVSVGARDYVKPALAALGIAPELWRVAVKPGKPFLFAAHGGKLVFGLPGNPVSAFVTFLLFVAPALRRWQGAAVHQTRPAVVPARLAEPARNDGDRPHYLRGWRDAAGDFHLAGLQESHALFALARATALLRLEPGQSCHAGETVSTVPLD